MAIPIHELLNFDKEITDLQKGTKFFSRYTGDELLDIMVSKTHRYEREKRIKVYYWIAVAQLKKEQFEIAADLANEILHTKGIQEDITAFATNLLAQVAQLKKEHEIAADLANEISHTKGIQEDITAFATNLLAQGEEEAGLLKQKPPERPVKRLHLESPS